MLSVILSGHVRTFQQTYQSFNDCFNMEKNVYCHSWNTRGHSDHVWWSNIGDGIINKVNEEKLSEKLKEYYNPKKILIEEQQKYVSKNPLYNSIGGYQSVHGMWQSIKNCYDMVKNSDIILKTRYDIFYNNIIDKKEIENVYNRRNLIYLLPTPHSKSAKIYSDILFFTSKEMFDKIITFNEEMDKYLNEAIKHHKIIEGERPFTAFLKTLDCEIKYSNLNCTLLRLNGDQHILY